MEETNRITSLGDFLNIQSVFILHLRELWITKEQSKTCYKTFFILNFKLTKAADTEWVKIPQSNIPVAPREYTWYLFHNCYNFQARIFFNSIIILS